LGVGGKVRVGLRVRVGARTCAALTASCFGMTSIDSANSAMASCSRLPMVVAKFSR